MATHVDFVGVLFVVWGVLTALIGLSTLALGVGAASLATSANRAGGHVAVGVTAAAFVTLAVIAIAWGVGHVVARRAAAPPSTTGRGWWR